MKYKKRMVTNVVSLVLFLWLASAVFAQEQTTNYSGDFWSRSTLTGDWGGVRNEWAKKGVTFDLSLTQIGQGIVSGGKDVGWEYGGRGDLILNLDTQKMGLWPGGFFMVEVEGNFGNAVNSQTGALMPVNTNQLFPLPGGHGVALPVVTYTQFFSEHFGVMVGKLPVMAADDNAFAHGKGDTQFMNIALNVVPLALFTAPYTPLGAIAIILPTKNPAEAMVKFATFTSTGKADSAGWDTINGDKVTFWGEGRVRTGFFGMTGHQLLGGLYSNRDFTSIDQRISLDPAARQIAKKSDSWAVYYNFDQYLYEPVKGSGKGFGIFGRFSVADGNPNFLHYFYSIGAGGKGVIPGRPVDEFGIGYYYMDVSNPTFTGPLGGTASFLRDEQGFEAYYNFAITPWMKLTPDIQIIRPAQKDKLSVSSGPPPVINKASIDTATVLGLRLQVIF
jgi:porin